MKIFALPTIQTKTINPKKPRARHTCHVCGAVGRSAPKRFLLGDSYVTSREHEVLQLIRSGKKRKAIAAELGIHPKTVDALMYNVVVRFNAANTQQAVMIFAELSAKQTPRSEPRGATVKANLS